MNLFDDISLNALHFYMTAPYPCSYLPVQMSRSQVATPSYLINTSLYSELVRQGFRRSGTYTYRPHCVGCNACVPLRIPVAQFAPNRSQRRAWKQHNGLIATIHPLQDSAEYFELYQHYQSIRHRGGGMDNDDRDSYCNFLLQTQVDSMLVEFRNDGQLQMVSVIDLLDDGLSSVYTFYDPDLPRARLGVYNVLWQIELCRKLNLDFVYLGYWIEHSRKMAYKIGYQPAQGLVDGVWRFLERFPGPAERKSD